MIYKFTTLSLIALLALFPNLPADSKAGWQQLAPGMELKRLSAAGDSQIVVLRIDPELWELQFFGPGSKGESSSRTAHAWAEAHNLNAVINAGMFDTDGRTHLGYLRYREEVNNGHANAYKSVAAFDPNDPRLPRFQIFDLDASGVTLQSIVKDYASAVQNLRLIKRPGASTWGQQQKKWSEAALGEDSNGRILFIFSRSPFTMHDLNQELLSSGIGLVAAQHLEGGPEAQLYIHAGKTELEMFGSYETSFREEQHEFHRMADSQRPGRASARGEAVTKIRYHHGAQRRGGYAEKALGKSKIKSKTFDAEELRKQRN